MLFPELHPVGSPFHSGFQNWDTWEPSTFFQSPTEDDEPALLTPQTSTEPLGSTFVKSGSTEPLNLKHSEPLAAGSDETARSGIDERKQRRMASNRLSARRSRLRKKEHLENLQNLLNRLRFENRERRNRAGFVAYQNQIVSAENERLRWEAAALRRRLLDVRGALVVRHIQQQLNPFNNFDFINGRQIKHHSLIT